LNDADYFPPESADLITQMLAALEPTLPSHDARFERIQAFFGSESFRSVPFARVTALFGATLARDVHSGRNPENFPGPGMFNDIDAVAAYAPFCDAMFVDREISHLASQGGLKEELAGTARLFSLRKDGRTAFIDYQANIEAKASPEHLKKVAEVYGDDWPKPYVELLSRRHPYA
jgi:hypothetical protein